MLKQAHMYLQDKALNMLSLIKHFCNIKNMRRSLYPPVEVRNKETNKKIPIK